mgnify:CR=1 FL=1
MLPIFFFQANFSGRCRRLFDYGEDDGDDLLEFANADDGNSRYHLEVNEGFLLGCRSYKGIRVSYCPSHAGIAHEVVYLG